MKQHLVRLGSALSSAVSTLLAIVLATFVAGLALLLPAQTETLPPLFGTQLPAELIPDFGTFYSAQLTNQPPLPYDPFPELPVYVVDAELEIFLIDDRLFDYDAWREEQAALREIEAAALGVSVEELYGGGGAYGPLGFSSEGLRLLLPVWQTNQVFLPFAGGETNGVYDLFATTNMSPNAPGFNPTNSALSSLNGTNWVWLDRCDPGETNFTEFLISDSEAYYRLGTMLDTDEDDLTDAYENLVSHTLISTNDTDGDGMEDGWEVLHGLNPLVDDSALDPDDDGTNNVQEFQNSSNPFDNMLVAWGNNASEQSTVPWDFGPVAGMAGGGARGSGGHTLVLTLEGTVLSWGDSSYDQTNFPVGLSNVFLVTAGGDQSGALTTDGVVEVWGREYDDAPSDLTNIVDLSAGYQHFIALRDNGTVVTWGRSNSPAHAVPSGLSDVASVSAGWNHNLALHSNGTVTVWGFGGEALDWNLTNAPSGLTDIEAISAGALHAVVLRNDGTVAAWGYNGGGETNVPAGLSNVVAIAADRGYTLALKSDDTVEGWGMGLPPIPPGLNQVKAIGTGPGHAFAVRQGVLTPLILRQPRSQGQRAGGAAVFDVWISSRSNPTYQWQKDDENLSGETNAMLTISNVQSASQGSYRVLATNHAGFVVSEEAELVLVTPPVIVSPTGPQLLWVPQGSNAVLSVHATAQGSQYSGFHYEWYLDGEVIPTSLSLSNLTLGFITPMKEGDYWVVVTNVAGSATSAVWTVRGVTPGSVVGWGDPWDRPSELEDAIELAAGDQFSMALREGGTVLSWGDNAYGQTNPPAAATDVIAIAAGLDHALALRENGTVVAWGRNHFGQTNGPVNLTNAIAVSAGGHQSLSLKADGSVVQWGQTNALAPSNTDISAIASGTNFHLALLVDETVLAWGDNSDGQTNVPASATNVVAIAAGGSHAWALREDGHVVAWGDNTYGQTNVPTDLTNAMGIAAGDAHSMALRNDGTVACWGDNSEGQTNPPIALKEIKLIAAGGKHSLASQFNMLVQYPVDVGSDLLLIYNTNSADSTFVKDYYLAHRPMASNANVLGVGCPAGEFIGTNEFITQLKEPMLDWLSANPTKHPGYMVLFLDIPSRLTNGSSASGIFGSVSSALRDHAPGIKPLITHINMNGTNDSIGYIDKLVWCGSNYSPGRVVLSAAAGEYGNTNFVLDNVRHGPGWPLPELDYSAQGWRMEETADAINGLGLPAVGVTYLDGIETNGALPFPPHINDATNVAGYISWGWHSRLGSLYATNDTVRWHGDSRWYVIQTFESFNGQRTVYSGNFILWFAADSFGGQGYSNTPVGAVTYVDEPGLPGNYPTEYFTRWANGKNLAISAWTSRVTPNLQVVGDPLVRK